MQFGAPLCRMALHSFRPGTILINASPADTLPLRSFMRLLGLILPVYLIVCGGLASAQEETKPAAPAPQQSPQPSTDAPADKSKIVYVSDFDLDVPNPAAEKNGGADKSAP